MRKLEKICLRQPQQLLGVSMCNLSLMIHLDSSIVMMSWCSAGGGEGPSSGDTPGYGPGCLVRGIPRCSSLLYSTASGRAECSASVGEDAARTGALLAAATVTPARSPTKLIAKPYK